MTFKQRIAIIALGLVVVASACASRSGEALVADPLRDEIKQISALRVGDHAAALLEIQDAFDALLNRHNDAPLDQIRLVDFYYQDILSKRRPHVPPSLFRALAERGDNLLKHVEGKVAFQARLSLLPLWIPVDLNVFAERSRTLLEATCGRPGP